MKELVFGIFMTPEGPKMETKMDPRLLVRTLAAVLEDVREQVAADRIKAELAAERPRIEVAPAGVIIGRG